LGASKSKSRSKSKIVKGRNWTRSAFHPLVEDA
jgi:hypothetical protein